jgi:precorrin-6A synthase
MRRLLLIGIGAGDPDQITVAATKAIDAFDVLFLVAKRADDELAGLRVRMVARHRTAGPYRTVELADPPRPWRDAPDYTRAVGVWRSARAAQWEAAIVGELGDREVGAFLVWGDPSLYESTLTVVEEIATRTPWVLDYEVIPGVSSVHALTARHRIPLNRVGRPVQITPARLIADGMPAGVDDVVVMLDASTTFSRLRPDGLEIYWGAYLGTDDEILISGRLADVADEIVRVREAARRRKGWIFDIYLLRRIR